ncbi:hypothetical protein QJQ45_019680 [Haematococcus lacustris]|nr:hypothetical protein QJQ45_019680 [Haematococcus lacustris]
MMRIIVGLRILIGSPALKIQALQVDEGEEKDIDIEQSSSCARNPGPDPGSWSNAYPYGAAPVSFRMAYALAVIMKEATGLVQLEAKANPAFAAAWQRLQARVDLEDDCCKESITELTAARTRFLTNNVLLQQLEAVSVHPDCTLSPASQKWLGNRLQAVRVAQRSSIACSCNEVVAQSEAGLCGSKVHMLGAHPEDLLAAHELGDSSSHQASVTQVAWAVEQAMCKRLASLTSAIANSSSATRSAHPTAFPGPTPGPGPWQDTSSSEASTAGGALWAVEQIQSRVAGLAERRSKLLAGLRRQLQLCSQLVTSLESLAAAASQFIDTELLGRQDKQDKFQLDVLSEHTASLCHKVQLVELQIMTQIYTASHCTALAQVHGILSSRAQQLAQSVEQVSAELAAYRDLGPAFEEVVAVYTRLSGELASAQQALSTFTALEEELQGRGL